MTNIFDNPNLAIFNAKAYHLFISKNMTHHEDRNFHGIAFKVNGKCRYTFKDGTVLNTSSNKIIYLPKHSYYQIEFLEPGECYAINFDISDEVDCPPFVVDVKNSTAILNMFKSALSAYTTKPVGYHHKCMKNLHSILEVISTETAGNYVPKYKENLITPAVEFIKKNLTSHSINIPHLAELCNISETYFRKIFKSVYGMSPVTYINSLKIEMAQELMDSNMYSINEVSELLGYPCIFSFSRDFKKYAGVTPGKYNK